MNKETKYVAQCQLQNSSYYCSSPTWRFFVRAAFSGVRLHTARVAIKNPTLVTIVCWSHEEVDAVHTRISLSMKLNILHPFAKDGCTLFFDPIVFKAFSNFKLFFVVVEVIMFGWENWLWNWSHASILGQHHRRANGGCSPIIGFAVDNFPNESFSRMAHQYGTR